MKKAKLLGLVVLFLFCTFSPQSAGSEDWRLDTKDAAAKLGERGRQKIEEARRGKEEVINGLMQWFEAGYSKRYILEGMGEEFRPQIEEAERRFKNK